VTGRRTLLLLVLAALALRAGDIPGPIDGPHEFRQTQTALAAWDIRERGLDLLHPRLPLFGDPWEAPMEYPVFQISAAAVDAASFWESLDLSIKLTALFYGILCGVLLYALCRELFERESTALWVAAAFLLAPFNVVWGTASLIEYAAVAFSLGYLLFFLRTLRQPRLPPLLAAIALGGLAFLTKSTTAVLVGPPMAVCGLAFLFAERNSDLPFWRRACVLLLLAGVPLCLAAAWVAHADAIKQASIYTEWLSSGSLEGWNFGTLAQRFDPANWLPIGQRVATQMINPLLVPFSLVGAVVTWRELRTLDAVRWDRGVAAALLVSPILVVLIFFNLYVVHDYYLVALTPIVALALGVGLDAAFRTPRGRIAVPATLAVAAGLGAFVWPPSPGAAEPNRDISVLRAARAHIDKDVAVIVSNDDWSSFAPFHLRRRAFMARENIIGPALESGMLAGAPYEWIVERIAREQPIGELEQRWPDATEYIVSDTSSSYRFVRLANAGQRVVERQSLLTSIDAVEGVRTSSTEDGAVRLDAAAENFFISWKLDPRIDPGAMDGILAEIEVDALRLGGFSLVRGEEIHNVRTRFLPNRTHRFFFPRELLAGETPLTGFRLVMVDSPDAVVSIAGLDLVRFGP
jgi:hypothetical protein